MICGEEEISICALSLCMRYEGGLARRLYDHYGSAQAVFSRPLSELTGHRGMRRSIVEKMTDPALRDQVTDVLKWLKSVNFRTLFLYHEDYPCRLRECPDAPLLLYVAGHSVFNEGPVLSVVGTRKATPYGKALCREIISGFKPLGIKPVIVSGLAFGIDITAHKAALENDLITVTVLPTGIDIIYPPAHLDIALQILERGAVLSEFPPETRGNRKNFLQRNRIIAGLADAILVVESKADGGALITAHHALGYSRDVLAVPGRSSDICSRGCNNLIRMNKAALVTSARDIAEVMQWEVSGKEQQVVQKELFNSLDDKDRQIVSRIRESGGDINTLGESLNIPFPELSARLVQLQVKGAVDCLENKEYNALI